MGRGRGSDVLIGGTGRDRFVFCNDDSADRVWDYEVGERILVEKDITNSALAYWSNYTILNLYRDGVYQYTVNLTGEFDDEDLQGNIRAGNLNSRTSVFEDFDLV